MANFNIPLDPAVISTVLTNNSGTLTNGSTVSGTLYTYAPTASQSNVANTSIVGTITNNVNNTLVNSSNVSGTILVSNTLSSSDSNNQVIFDSTNNRTLLVSHGFIFKNDNGIITPINKSKHWYSYPFTSANISTFTVPSGVNYIFVKMWGAGGGGGAYGGWNQGSQGGGGGYSHGLIPVQPGDTVNIIPGQRGLSRSTTAAYPNGGVGTSGTDNRYCANGGGSSQISVTSVNSGNWCMFAGGGGGGGSCNGYARNNGGAGGGYFGQSGNQNNYSDGGSYNCFGVGGNQFNGGNAGVGDSSYNGSPGAYNSGGSYYGPTAGSYGAGGGGGYYGGGAGSYYSGASSMGGGGGGSGYIHPSILMGVTMTGSGLTPANADDPDLITSLVGGAAGSSSTNGFQFANGGDEDGFGGWGVVVVYY